MIHKEEKKSLDMDEKCINNVGFIRSEVVREQIEIWFMHLEAKEKRLKMMQKMLLAVACINLKLLEACHFQFNIPCQFGVTLYLICSQTSGI